MSSSLQEAFEGKTDFEGQKIADAIVRNVLVASTATAFILGFFMQSLRITFGTIGISTVLLMVAVIPPWPMYRRNSVKWLPVKPASKRE